MNANEKIDKLSLNISKGLKILTCLTNNDNIIQFSDDLETINTYKTKEPLSNLQIFSEIITTHKMTTNSIEFLSFSDKLNKTILSCNMALLSTETNAIDRQHLINSKINSYFYDKFAHTIYAILDNNYFLIMAPKIFLGNKLDNSNTNSNNFCEIKKVAKLKGTHENLSKPSTMEIFRKDLVILNENGLEAINLAEFELEEDFSNVDLRNVKFPLKILSNDFRIPYGKIINGYYILVKTDANSISLLELVHPSNKINGSDDFNLNFKLPVIFLALIVLFFYHLFKNKFGGEVKQENLHKNRKEVMDKLKDFGIFDFKNIPNDAKGNYDENYEEEGYSDEENYESYKQKINEFLNNNKKKDN